MLDMKSESRNMDTVFIHSSFRTGSTWLWSKFRENENTYCYYEVFNEVLEDLDQRTIQLSSAAWNSHHPPGPPYFTEFTPLLKDCGISGFDRDMAINDFFLQAGDNLDRITKTSNYLMSLVNLARRMDRIPVLSCTRSIGRVNTIRKIIGGSHILLKRSLFNQWSSYLDQSNNGNHFFLQEMVSIISLHFNIAPPFISALYLDPEIDFNNLSDYQCDNLLIAFLCFHMYLYIKHWNDFDLVLDFSNKQSFSSINREAIKIQKLTSLSIDISDYKEATSTTKKIVFNFERVRSIVSFLFSGGLPGISKNRLNSFIKKELVKFETDLNLYLNLNNI